MVWMPDRKRAIYYGANHGAPHRTNDVWEYDLPSNTWVCLYGPDNMRGAENWKQNLDPDSLKTGIPRTRRGGPAVIAHSWWQLAYDPQLKAMLTFCSWSMVPGHVREARKKGSHKPPLWAFFPEKKQWQPITGSKFEGKRPRYQNASALEYVPQRKATIWCSNNWANRGMWAYDSADNTWTQLKPNGGSTKEFQSNAPPPEQVMAFAPDRGMLIGHWGKVDRKTGKRQIRTSHFSFQTNAWQVVEGKGHGEQGIIPPGHDARTNFVYDQVARVCLLWDGKHLWSYDPDGARWTRLQIKGDPPPTGGRDVMLAYYDVARNVFVINGQWVYRHARRPEPGRT
jgi:hypothetical protein